MLVRDGADGLEVFMVRRSLRLVFAGGAHVFPGGAVDAADREIAGEGSLPFKVAAVRECFEEAGFLLAVDAAGEVVRLDDPATAERFFQYRREIASGERSLSDVCGTEGCGWPSTRCTTSAAGLRPKERLGASTPASSCARRPTPRRPCTMPKRPLPTSGCGLPTSFSAIAMAPSTS